MEETQASKCCVGGTNGEFIFDESPKRGYCPADKDSNVFKKNVLLFEIGYPKISNFGSSACFFSSGSVIDRGAQTGSILGFPLGTFGVLLVVQENASLTTP